MSDYGWSFPQRYHVILVTCWERTEPRGCVIFVAAEIFNGHNRVKLDEPSSARVCFHVMMN